MRAIVRRALTDPDALLLPNGNMRGTYRIVSRVGPVGTRASQHSVRVIVARDGTIINAFPVRDR